jgi:hypothetical protein
MRLFGLRGALCVLVITIGTCRPTLGNSAQGKRQNVEFLHSYDTSFATEIANAIPVSADNLLPLLPSEYELIPAATFGIGGLDEGIVVIVNFQGMDPSIDRRPRRRNPSTRTYVTILVAAPAAAEVAGVDAPGSLHFYTLASYTDDAEYAANLRVADWPIEFVPRIAFGREIDDTTEVGQVLVEVPSRNSPFYSFNEAFGHAPAGNVDAVFWFNGKKGTALLHFINEPARQGDALSLVFTPPGSRWNELLAGGGFGPGPTDPETGFESVVAPSLNFLYPEGSRGRILLLKTRKHLK